MRHFVQSLFLLFILLLFHTQVIAGTRSGLLLWYQTIIPSLLPFILVTNALAETNAYHCTATYFHKYIPHHIYEIMAIILGNLCGYPIGGKIINDFVKNQHLLPEQANLLLSLASQTSPMFLIGYIHVHILNKTIPLFIFLFSIYFPTFVLTIVRYRTLPKKHSSFHTPPNITPHRLYITDTFLNTTKILVNIGMYVIIFSILIRILLPVCQFSIMKLLLSSMEITTGLTLLSSLHIPAFFKTSFICALSSFGGLCSAYQIKGVLNYPGASIKKYLWDKCILSTGTFFLIYVYMLIVNSFY